MPLHQHALTSTQGNERDAALKTSQVVERQPVTGKTAMKTLHTEIVARTISSYQPSVILGGRPPPVSAVEVQLTHQQRTTLAQLRSGYCRLLNSYKHRIDQTVAGTCDDCRPGPHDVAHLFHCPAHPTNLTPADLWTKQADAIAFLAHLLPNLD